MVPEVQPSQLQECSWRGPRGLCLCSHLPWVYCRARVSKGGKTGLLPGSVSQIGHCVWLWFRRTWRFLSLPRGIIHIKETSVTPLPVWDAKEVTFLVISEFTVSEPHFTVFLPCPHSACHGSPGDAHYSWLAFLPAVSWRSSASPWLKPVMF